MQSVKLDLGHIKNKQVLYFYNLILRLWCFTHWLKKTFFVCFVLKSLSNIRTKPCVHRVASLQCAVDNVWQVMVLTENTSRTCDN